MNNKTILGILAIVLGLLIIIFPLASSFIFSINLGVSFLFLGIYYLIYLLELFKGGLCPLYDYRNHINNFSAVPDVQHSRI